MKQIKLTQAKVARVDDADFDWLNQFKWYFTHGYARARISGKNVYMHRLINETEKGFDTDHINRDGLDNRRSNLRTVTHASNILNSKLSSVNKSGYKGVSWDKEKKKWKAKLRNSHIGYFNSLSETITARKLAEKRFN